MLPQCIKTGDGRAHPQEPADVSSWERQISPFQMEALNASWETPVSFIVANPLRPHPSQSLQQHGVGADRWPGCSCRQGLNQS